MHTPTPWAAHRHLHARLAQRDVDPMDGANLLETGKDPFNRGAHLLVRALLDPTGFVPDIARGQHKAKRTALGLGAHRFDQTLVHSM